MIGVQIFLSYARDDDAVPPGPPGKSGFVSFLCDNLTWQFTKTPSRPRIWRDLREVGPGHQFDTRIETAIATSSLFLVVLSENWLASQYCAKELACFADYWRGKGERDEKIRERIVVVSKRHVPVETRPALLQGQQSFEFYSVERFGGHDHDCEFFKCGESPDRLFYDRIDELSAHLWAETRRAVPENCDSQQQPRVEAVRFTPKKSRTIFLAKPASDMAEAYDRLTKELEGRGYRVTPGRHEEIPHDPSALDFVDAALDAAEMSIHLLGEKFGRSPEDLPPISKLQLERAARRGANESVFHRLIWAPKQFKVGLAGTALRRDPQEVLAKFDRQLATDKISGEELSRFVDFVAQRLMRLAPTVDEPAHIPAESSIYVYHAEADWEYAILLKRALEERQVEVELPAEVGTDAELRAFHRKMLKQCDAVALCWAHASEPWVRSTADELKDWRALGRAAPFVFRGVVTGPPPDRRKRNVKDVFPRGAFDRIVDLEDNDLPLPELLDSLIPQPSCV